MVSVVGSSIADKAPAPLEEIFLRSECLREPGTALRRDRQILFRKARARPSTIFAFVTPDTAGEIGIDASVYRNERLLRSSAR